MNVKELRQLLETLPDEMEILETRCSDYDLMSIDSWSVVEAVNTGNGWVMRSHPTMSETNAAKAKKYLHFSGN